MCALAVDDDLAILYQQQRGPPFGLWQAGGLVRVEAHIPHMHGGVCFGGAFALAQLACNQAYLACVIGQRHGGDGVSGNALVVRRGHFVFGRQIDPQLHHLERAAALAVRCGVKLGVQNACAGSHPLHVACADHAARARAVAVFHLAVVHNGHGLKAPVGVGAHASAMRIGVGAEAGRRGIVQHQKRAALLRALPIAKHALHRKTIAHPVATGGVFDFPYRFESGGGGDSSSGHEKTPC